MTQPENCSKCNSTKIIPNARIIDRGDYNSVRDLSVQVYEDPEALLFKGVHEGQLTARICGDCGYVEMYVDNPAELYEVFVSANPE
jgi:hypothetical protein